MRTSRKPTRKQRAAPRAQTRSLGVKTRDVKKSLPKSVSVSIIYENERYVVVDKPALLDSQNSRADRPSVTQWLSERYKFAGLVHRLDFGTSGLMICAKIPQAARELTALLQAGHISRTYWAVVFGKNLPEEGSWNEPLEGKSALTHFRILERFPNATLVEVDLETGRKHQIRRHFAEASHPLLGDHLYGKGGARLLFGRPALHAKALTVEDDRFESDLPKDFVELLNRLRAAKRT